MTYPQTQIKNLLLWALGLFLLTAGGLAFGATPGGNPTNLQSLSNLSLQDADNVISQFMQGFSAIGSKFAVYAQSLFYLIGSLSVAYAYGWKKIIVGGEDLGGIFGGVATRILTLVLFGLAFSPAAGNSLGLQNAPIIDAPRVLLSTVQGVVGSLVGSSVNGVNGGVGLSNGYGDSRTGVGSGSVLGQFQGSLSAEEKAGSVLQSPSSFINSGGNTATVAFNTTAIFNRYLELFKAFYKFPSYVSGFQIFDACDAEAKRGADGAFIGTGGAIESVLYGTCKVGAGLEVIPLFVATIFAFLVASLAAFFSALLYIGAGIMLSVAQLELIFGAAVGVFMFAGFATDSTQEYARSYLKFLGLTTLLILSYATFFIIADAFIFAKVLREAQALSLGFTQFMGTIEANELRAAIANGTADSINSGIVCATSNCQVSASGQIIDGQLRNGFAAPVISFVLVYFLPSAIKVTVVCFIAYFFMGKIQSVINQLGVGQMAASSGSAGASSMASSAKMISNTTQVAGSSMGRATGAVSTGVTSAGLGAARGIASKIRGQ